MITGREDWIVKLGPFTRVNAAKTRKQSREGAVRRIMDDSKIIMKRAKVLIPELMKDAACAGGEEPEVKEEDVKPQVYSYQIAEKNWFSIATSGAFGVNDPAHKGRGFRVRIRKSYVHQYVAKE